MVHVQFTTGLIINIAGFLDVHDTFASHNQIPNNPIWWALAKTLQSQAPSPDKKKTFIITAHS